MALTGWTVRDVEDNLCMSFTTVPTFAAEYYVMH